LILPPSFWRSPVAPVWRTLSDPAKSTRFNVETLTAPLLPLSSPRSTSSSSSLASSSLSSTFFFVSLSRLSTVILKIVCDRELLSFIPVAATLRFFSPANSTLNKLSMLVTIVSFELTNTPRCLSSRTARVASSLLSPDTNRSLTSSL